MPDDLAGMDEDFRRQLNGLPPLERNDKLSWKLKLFYAFILLILILEIAYCGGPGMHQPTMKERCQDLIQSFGKRCMLNHSQLQQCCEFDEFKYTRRCGNGRGTAECF